MKLIHLSIASIILCAIGLLVFLVITVMSTGKLLDQQSEIAEMLRLKEDIDDFSVASDGLLIYGADAGLWRAYVEDARLIQERLLRFGETYPDSTKAARRIDSIIKVIDRVLTQDRMEYANPAQSSDGIGPMNLSPRVASKMTLVASHGVALDTALDDVLVERQNQIGQNQNRIVATLSASTLLFGMLCIIAFLLVHHRLAIPARALLHTIHRQHKGETEVRTRVSGNDELAQLAASLNNMLDQREVLDKELQARKAELEENEKLLSETQRVASLGSWRLNLSTDKLIWSEETYRIVGVSPDSFIPSREAFFARVHPDDLEKLHRVRTPALKGEQPHDVVFRIIRPDGVIRYVHERAEAEFDENGNAVVFAGSIQDITERKQLDARLLQYSQLVESSTDMCVIYDEHFHFRYVNLAYCNFIGKPRDAIEGHHASEILGSQLFNEEVGPRLQKALRGEPVEFELVRENDLGDKTAVLVKYFPITSMSHSQYVGAILTDISELKAAQHNLIEQTRLVQLAGQIARLGGWSVDLASGAIIWSDVVAELHGKPHGYRPTLAEGIQFYAKKERDRIRDVFTRCAEQGISFDDVFEIVDANGKHRWVRSVGEAIHDENGKIVRVDGAFQDVTERQQLIIKLESYADNLRKTHDELEQMLKTRQALINSLPAHIALLDNEGTIIDVNQQWRHYGEANEYAGNDDFGVGTNYINICETSRGECEEEARTLAKGLRSVLAGKKKSFVLEYPCHSPAKEQWFRVMANQIYSEEHMETPVGAVVMHVDVTERKKAELALNKLAYEDMLTGLLSRHGFVQKLAQYLEDMNWEDNGMLLHLDIINMHDINEAHGYNAGDQLFVSIGEQLQSITAAEAIIGRPGGDEFIVYIPGMAVISEETICEQIDAALAEPIVIGDVASIMVRCRIGYTIIGGRQRDVEALLHEAELALFQCRYEGTGDHWSRFTLEMGEASRQRMTITREMHQALLKNEFELHFQPKVNLDDGTVVACEALIRWQHPEHGMLSPAVFIPIAEQSQLIRPLGEWVMNEACHHLREWMNEELDIVRVSINVSMVQFVDDSFVDKISSALMKHSISPENLTLEITESVFENHTNILRSKLEQLQKMGLRTSLDDFGTGYSSLRYLQQFHFDEIKIDQSFVSKMLEERYSKRIVETILGIARVLEAEVVAEGIETTEIAEALAHLGCRIGQGYYYSPPMAAEDFRWLLMSHERLPISAKRKQ